MTEIISIKEGNAEITFDGKFVKWQNVEKKFFWLLKDVKKFSFPVNHIAAIRYSKERPPFSLKAFILWIIFIIVGIFTIPFLIGLILIPLWAYIIYLLFKPVEWIYIQSSWGDSELFAVNNRENKNKAEVLISKVEESM